MIQKQYHKASKRFLNDLGLPDTEDNLEQLLVLAECLVIYSSRDGVYGAAWRQYGAVSNVLSMARKVDRVMNEWWSSLLRGEVSDRDGEELDDAVDLINYTVFFLRNVRDGNISGSMPERPQHPSSGERGRG